MARRYFLTGVQVPFPLLDAARLGRPEGPGYRGAVGFSRAELESFRDVAVPDLVGPGLQLLFVGINPGLWTAATQTHFAHPGNRFYPALRLAGIVDREIDRAAGMTDDDRRYLVGRGIGHHQPGQPGHGPGRRAQSAELRAGRLRLAELVARATGRESSPSPASPRTGPPSAGPSASAGEQPESLAGARLWVVPNPSGLNAHAHAGHAGRGVRGTGPGRWVVGVEISPPPPAAPAAAPAAAAAADAASSIASLTALAAQSPSVSCFARARNAFLSSARTTFGSSLVTCSSAIRRDRSLGRSLTADQRALQSPAHLVLRFPRPCRPRGPRDEPQHRALGSDQYPGPRQPLQQAVA